MAKLAGRARVVGHNHTLSACATEPVTPPKFSGQAKKSHPRRAIFAVKTAFGKCKVNNFYEKARILLISFGSLIFFCTFAAQLGNLYGCHY